MTCDAVQRRLLSLTEPRRPPTELRRHLTACVACRSVLGRLLEVEELVPAIPVPPSVGRAALVHRILTDPTIRASVRDKAPKVVKVRSWRPALAAAAVLLIGVVTLVAVRRPWQSPGTPVAPPDPLLAKVVDCDQELAKAKTPAERLAGLTKLADTLHAQAKSIARVAPPDDLAKLAGMYQHVIEKGVRPQAARLTRAEDRGPLEAADKKLFETAQVAEKLTREVPGPAQPAFRSIAGAALAAHQQLQQQLTDGRAPG
jgi:hypothetical protein